jgi:solute:Na+ symporter, SSS family
LIATEDFYRFARPACTDRERLRAGRIVVVLSGCAAAAFALELAHTQGTALSLYYTVSAIVAGGLAGLFLLAFLFRGATHGGAVAGIMASLLFTVWATVTVNQRMPWLGPFRFPWHDYLIGAVGHVVLLLVAVPVSYLWPGSGPRAPDKTLWGWLALSRSAPSSVAMSQAHFHPSSERS